MTYYIIENTFAAACYNNNSIAELEAALAAAPDAADMRAWGLSEAEWREQIKLALEAKRADADQDD